MSQYPVFMGLKMSADLADRLRRAAREDDRPLSAFVRRLLVTALDLRQADAR